MKRRTFITGVAAGMALASGSAAHASDGARLRPITLSDLAIIGEGLKSPETAIASRDGRVFVTDPNAACAIIAPDGSISQVGKAVAPLGMALDSQRRMVIANFGLTRNLAGPLQRLDLTSGAVETLVESINGRKLVASNSVAIARDGTIYCTHTSWGPAVDKCINPAVADGFVYRLDPGGRATIVSEGLRGPNGCCLDADEKHLLVAQTAGGQILRLKRLPDGRLGPPQSYGPSLGVIPANVTVEQILERPAAERSRMGHPDGIALDADGNLWVTLVFANKVVAITPQGKVIVVIDDPEGKVVSAPSSVSWGGPDLTDLYIGMIGKNHVAKARTPAPGLALAHQI